jgi:hypothetical protein
MSLRELLIERICFVLDDEELASRYLTNISELYTIPDSDLLELYEDTFLMLDKDQDA